MAVCQIQLTRGGTSGQLDGDIPGCAPRCLRAIETVKRSGVSKMLGHRYVCVIYAWLPMAAR
jgi:hypothetical protein